MPDTTAQRPEKKFYLETFGCQMNAHDSEKVIGTLIHEGYAQVETVEDAPHKREETIDIVMAK